MADRIARIWTGSVWEQISAPVSVPNAVAYYQSTAPTGVATGTIWIDSDDGMTYTYNGSGWISIASLSSADFTGNVTVLSEDTDGVAGVRNVTHSTSAPSGGADGDIWLVYS